MDEWQQKRLTDRELRALLDRLFPNGFASPDVLDEIAPDGWERSSLLACFHPSIERLFEERLSMHRHLEELRRVRPVRGDATGDASQPEPNLEDVRREYEPRPVQRDEEVTALVGMCLWDIFSDNHEVSTADGRLADLGSFRGSSAFLDEYLNPDGGWWREGDDMRFYMETIFLRNRADLAPVYSMIFRRLHAVGADWIYHFPELSWWSSRHATAIGKRHAPTQWQGVLLTRSKRNGIELASIGCARSSPRYTHRRQRRQWIGCRPRPFGRIARCTGAIPAAGRRYEEKRHSRLAENGASASAHSSGTLMPDPARRPTLRMLILRERWRASRLPSSVGASRP